MENPGHPIASPKFARNALGTRSTGSSTSPELYDRNNPFIRKGQPAQFSAYNITKSARSSFADAVWSSQGTQGTQPDTANTSFMTERSVDQKLQAARTEIFPPHADYRRDQDALSTMNITHDGILSQDYLPSSSNFGSIDEESLQNAFNRVEAATRGSDVPVHDDTNRCVGLGPPRRDVSVGTKSRKPFVDPTAVGDVTPALQRESHHVRNIPNCNLFVDENIDDPKGIPYFILFICQRLVMQTPASLRDLLCKVRPEGLCNSLESFCNSITTYFRPSSVKFNAKELTRLWQAKEHNFEGCTFKGQISLNSSSTEPVFRLQLQSVELDKSCRFQRKFGSDRFLYLTAPIFKGRSGSNAAELKRIESRWHEWLLNEHSFLGRTWRVFHVEPLKLKKSKHKKIDPTHDKRVILFATKGHDIDQPRSIQDLINWFMPLADLKDASFCKTYARLDLGLSRTVSTLTFKPSQRRFVRDKMSNEEAEAEEYNDSRLEWPPVLKPEVMNDGCALISVGAAHLIWNRFKEVYHVTGPLPSVFQGRIGGAKGLWIVSEESSTRDPEHLDIWIEISESQQKFPPHREDLDDETFDGHRLTFELSNYSSLPGSSELHISFIPIMVDRGITVEAIAKCMKACLDDERTQLLKVLTEPERLYDWIHRNGSRASDGREINWQASLPSQLEEMFKLLLESGFDPTKLQYFANRLEYFIGLRQINQEKALRTPLGKTTYLFGIADPCGILEPGTIYVQFSSRFEDERTGHCYSCLKDMDILVARQPACRRSDIQKVRTVFCPRLSHLYDVVVFPTRGRYPLAGKLQGGDYDGDQFWLCWEPTLVDAFKNAPAPVEVPDPVRFGIKTDKRKLEDVMDLRNLNTVTYFLREAFQFRSHASLLGWVTTFLEGQAYKENRVYSSLLDHLCDIHDLLVDAPKQGYVYTQAAFNKYTNNILNLKGSAKPRYKQAMDACLNGKTPDDVDLSRPESHRHNENRVLDYLYFDILRAHNKGTLELVKEVLAKPKEKDEVLLHPYKHLTDQKIPIVDEELRMLKESIRKIRHVWNDSFINKNLTPERKISLVEECYSDFCAILPTNTSHPAIKPWTQEYMGDSLVMWDAIKASTLYAMLPGSTKPDFMFQMAGEELTKLKAFSFSRSRTIIPRIYSIVKPKRLKMPIEYDEVDSSDDESEDEDEAQRVGARSREEKSE